jgi:hypothetical protein
MVIQLAIFKYRNRDGSIDYALYLTDQVKRFSKSVTGLKSFDDLCVAVHNVMSERQRPRRKAPANLHIAIRDESNHSRKARKGGIPNDITPLQFQQSEIKAISTIALTATTDACA